MSSMMVSRDEHVPMYVYVCAREHVHVLSTLAERFQPCSNTLVHHKKPRYNLRRLCSVRCVRYERAADPCLRPPLATLTPIGVLYRLLYLASDIPTFVPTHTDGVGSLRTSSWTFYLMPSRTTMGLRSHRPYRLYPLPRPLHQPSIVPAIPSCLRRLPTCSMRQSPLWQFMQWRRRIGIGLNG